MMATDDFRPLPTPPQVLSHPYFAGFVNSDASRRRYAEVSLSAAPRYVSTVDDGRRLHAAEYREYLARELAVALVDTPVVTAPTADWADEDDMGA